MKKIVIAAAVLASSALVSSTLAVAANGAGTVLSSAMDGSSVPGGSGDSNGQGVFYASADAASGSLCYKLNVANLSGATVAHIHEGGAGSPGRPVVSLRIGNNECTAIDPAVMQDILADPADYYVDVLSTAHPQGALRGQLVAG